MKSRRIWLKKAAAAALQCNYPKNTGTRDVRTILCMPCWPNFIAKCFLTELFSKVSALELLQRVLVVKMADHLHKPAVMLQEQTEVGSIRHCAKWLTSGFSTV